MKQHPLIPTLLALGAMAFSVPAFTQGEHGGTEGRSERGHGARAAEGSDADKLFEIVRQARADVRAMRKAAGFPDTGEHEGRREGRGEHGEGRREGRGEHGEGRREGRGEHGEGRREGRGEHGEGRREGRGEHGEGRREGRGEHGEGRREGRGEHGEGRREGPRGHGEGRSDSGHEEEGGRRLAKGETWNETRNGAHLVLEFDSKKQSFVGTVHNTTSTTLSDVRVEVHLSNGVELGPTRRADLAPGAKIAVELSAANEAFTWWTTHPEHGTEENHGPGHERERAERDDRPGDPTLRPLYNELLLLRREIQSLSDLLANERR